VSKEPEYLRRLRASRQKAQPAGRGEPGDPGGLSPQEQEAVRWAKETAGTGLRSIRGLPGARYAVLLRVLSATGERLHSLEGLAGREALKRRLMPDSGFGEEVLAGYEIRGGRPISFETVGGEVKLRMGTPRAGANPVDPEKMLRQARAQAARQARSRTSKKER